MTQTTKKPINEMEVPELRAHIDQLKAERDAHSELAASFNDEIKKAHARVLELTVVFQRGDIVRDERGVEYRVSHVNLSGEELTLRGIRLTKEGHEAHKDPRVILSPRLTRVTQ